MNEITITRPELILVAGTRAALGIGVGLLLADHIADVPRRTIGWTLTIAGALITIPLAFEVRGKPTLTTSSRSMPARERSLVS